MLKQEVIKNGLLLGLFALLCTALVAGVNYGTKDKIQFQEQQQLIRTLAQIVPEDSYDNQLYKQCIRLSAPEALGTDEVLSAYVATKAGKAIAIAMEAIAPDGYNGQIKLIMGISASGKVLGVRTLSHQETPGLGDKIDLRKSDWVTHFKGKHYQGDDDPRWKVKKDGGEFDQFTGATITPRAYVRAISRTLKYFKRNKQALFKQAPNCHLADTLVKSRDNEVNHG